MRKCFGPGELWQLAESKSIKLDQAHNLIRHMLLLGADNLLMLILFEYQAHIICFSGISQSGTYYSYYWHYYIYFWHVLIILWYIMGGNIFWCNANGDDSRGPQLTYTIQRHDVGNVGPQLTSTAKKRDLSNAAPQLSSTVKQMWR